MWLVTSELYPTNLRSQALGICSTVARVFGLVCPFVANLAVLWPPLPMVVLGVPTLLAGVAAWLTLPETRKSDLPQTMEEAKRIKA